MPYEGVFLIGFIWILIEFSGLDSEIRKEVDYT
jgi:hypothetical protein